jgi:hypothetical protein
MMLHQDCSRHEWIGGLDAMDQIVTMDDATTRSTKAFWRPRRARLDVSGTAEAVLEVFGQHGLPLSL